jgi:DNA replication protein DnaC
LEPLRQEARAQERTAADVRDRRRTAEVPAQEEKQVTMRPVRARCPSRQTVESVAWGFQPAVDRQKRQEWATGRFIAPGDHVVFGGPPGTGKTHLALAVGLKAVPPRYRTRFTAAMSLIAARTTADAEHRLEERRQHDRLPTRLSLDEMG